MALRHLALIGPTAVGKSAIGLEVAAALGDVEIVSLDSMQVYRGMDIGTAKPSGDEQARVPHHLIDVADPGEEWSVARTQAAARTVVAEIEARGRRALLLGGTGLYVQAVVDRLELPGEDLTVRAELEAKTSKPGGVAAAYGELQRLDPTAASRIDEHNQRRIVRALEVIAVTGRPFSSFGGGMAQFGPTAFPVDQVGVWVPRSVSGLRIAARVQEMRAAGFEAEVRRLAAAGPLSRTAAQAIGYRELLAEVEARPARGDLHGGPVAVEDGVFDLIVRRTRSFARRQRMWFRRDPRVTWLAAVENPIALTPVLLARWRSS